MTQQPDPFGPEIAHDHPFLGWEDAKPGWLGDDERLIVRGIAWDHAFGVRLRSDHPASLLVAYNAAHPDTTFNALHMGSDGPPANADPNGRVLFASGRTEDFEEPYRWQHWQQASDIIAYDALPQPTAATVQVEKRTEAEIVLAYVDQALEVLRHHSADAPGTPTRDALEWINAARHPAARRRVPLPDAPPLDRFMAENPDAVIPDPETAQKLIEFGGRGNG